jgi:ubiquinone/menaquinone biosynthesis C-methylase UbiE
LDQNQKAYADRRIVQHYAQLQQLQPAEATVLKFLKGLTPLKMLDIGVGGGRTTPHFAAIATEYIGIDYSSEMIAACQQRFAPAKQTQFAVGDARDLSQFADNSFDFILFSFNGIDYVSHADRLKILQEIHRVGKSNSYFCFSSHNLYRFEHEFMLKSQFTFNPLTTYVNLVMFAIMRWLNRSLSLTQLKVMDYTIVRDESHNFCLNTYYVRSAYQLAQLAPYFHNIKIYSWQQGQELTSEADLAATPDRWLYYLCRVKKSGVAESGYE